jgi:hypothetical protein
MISGELQPLQIFQGPNLSPLRAQEVKPHRVKLQFTLNIRVKPNQNIQISSIKSPPNELLPRTCTYIPSHPHRKHTIVRDTLSYPSPTHCLLLQNLSPSRKRKNKENGKIINLVPKKIR